MNYIKDLLKTHQQKFVLALGFLLVAGISFGLGRFGASHSGNFEMKIEQAFVPPTNYTPSVAGIQSDNSSATTSATKAKNTSVLNCEGKIKGASSMIYHVPGDAFYKRTTKPIACFDTEAQAVAAGFKKSGK